MKGGIKAVVGGVKENAQVLGLNARCGVELFDGSLEERPHVRGGAAACERSIEGEMCGKRKVVCERRQREAGEEGARARGKGT